MNTMLSLSKKIFFSYLILPIFLVGIFFLPFSHTAFADGATLSFEPSSQTIGLGDEFSVDLILDSGGVSVNTIGGDLTFSDSTLTLERVETAGSIVTSWIQSPIIDGNSVTFSGIMPGGYESVVDPTTGIYSPGTVLTLVFHADAPGQATVALDDSHLYLNDGLGTETPVASSPLTFSIGAAGTGLSSALSTDKTPPEPFTPIVSSSPDLYGGSYALFFSTTDEGSGVAYYEVSEGNHDWVRATSPYLLTDQSLRSVIRVKAVDLAGNFRIEQVNGASNFQKGLLLIPLCLLALLLLFFLAIYQRMRKRAKKR